MSNFISSRVNSAPRRKLRMAVSGELLVRRAAMVSEEAYQLYKRRQEPYWLVNVAEYAFENGPLRPARCPSHHLHVRDGTGGFCRLAYLRTSVQQREYRDHFRSHED